ncbi:MAG TPA: OsmC family protein [Candidatus Acidoferrales bacterium]|nr:OsmC family protein [Candidatus Acidoferrales bacterium]
MESGLYKVAVKWAEKRKGWAEAASVPGGIAFSAPPEFGGEPGLWSPEHLLVLSVSSCFLTSLLFFADRGGLALAAYEAEGEGRLEQVPGQGYRFAEVVLRPVVLVEKEGDVALAQRLLEKAKRACIVSNSLSAPLRVEARVEVALPAEKV